MKEKPTYIVECKFDYYWDRSRNCGGVYRSLGAARAAIKKQGSQARRYRILKRSSTIIKP